MTLVPRVGNAIARISVPQSVQKVFLATSKEGPAAIAPLEGSVIIGRSVAETLRSGFLGLQERLTEESAAAIIWLWGVKFMQRLFDWVKPLIFPKGKHLSGEIAWNRPGRRISNVDLTPQELFTVNAKEMKTLQHIKALRLLASTGVALAGVAYVVPKLNQLKTNWILRNFYEGKSPKPNGGEIVPSGVGRTMQTIVPAGVSTSAMPTSASPTATPATTRNTVPQPFQAFFPPNFSSSLEVPSPPSNTVPTPHPNRGIFVPGGLGRPTETIVQAGVPTSAMPTTASPTSTPAFRPTAHFTGSRSNFSSQAQLNNQPGMPGTLSNQSPRFGLLNPSVFSNMLQTLGYGIEHTTYGNILVVDNGIVVGRAHIANKRSKFEAVEVIFRDVVSLYFYMLFAPHVMKLFGNTLNPLFQTHLQLQPKVTEALTNAIGHGLTERVRQWMKQEPDPVKRAEMQSAFERGAVPKDFVLELLAGSKNPILMQPAENVKKALRTANLEGPHGLLEVFRKEMATYGWNEQQAQHWDTQVQRFMRHASPSHWNTTDLERLITSIQQGNDQFSTLSEPQRKELVVSLKNAFRHTVGVQVDLSDTLRLNGQPLDKTHIIGGIWQQLKPDEREALSGRIRRMSQVDGLNQVSTLWRRSVNLCRDSVGEHSTLMQQGEMLADWIDEAVTRNLTISELLEQQLGALKTTLQEKGLVQPGEALTSEKLRELQYSLHVQKGSGIRQLISQVTKMNTLLGSASSEHPLDTQIVERMESLLAEMLQNVEPDSNVRPILKGYQQLIHERLQGTQGRLFSLAIPDGDVMLDAKLRELLVGGLQNDGTFLKNAQNIVGELLTDRRNLKNPANIEKLRASMTTYGEKLMDYLDKDVALAKEELPKLVQWGGTEGPAEVFQKLNRNLNYMGRTISMVGAMLCLGILVPKMQYLITRKLTGTDENPGISSAERNLGIQHSNQVAQLPG